MQLDSPGNSCKSLSVEGYLEEICPHLDELWSWGNIRSPMDDGKEKVDFELILKLF